MNVMKLNNRLVKSYIKTDSVVYWLALDTGNTGCVSLTSLGLQIFTKIIKLHMNLSGESQLSILKSLSVSCVSTLID